MSYCRYSPDCDLYLCSSVYGGFNGSYRTPGSHGTIAGSTVREHFSCVTRVEALETSLERAWAALRDVDVSAYEILVGKIQSGWRHAAGNHAFLTAEEELVMR